MVGHFACDFGVSASSYALPSDIIGALGGSFLMRHAALGCLVLFGLILFPSNSIFAQDDSAVSTQTLDKRAFDLAMALVAAGSEEERNKLLVTQPSVVTAELARA